MSDLQNAVIKLMSSPHYKKLAAYEPPFNPFEIVGATHRELIHSSALAWLLRDEANKEFRQRFVAKIATDKPKLGLSVPDDHGDFPLKSREFPLKSKEIKTEYSFEAGANFEAGSIDVFAHFESLNLVIGIEVKVWAGEQPEQIERYQKFLCQEYLDPIYKKVIVFLTREGRPSKTANSDTPVLEMSWSDIALMIREMRSALGDENNFRMQFLQHLERNIVIYQTKEEQRIVRKLLSEVDHAETLAEIIDNRQQDKVREILNEGDNEKILDKIIENMPLQGYSAQWKKIVAKICGVKEDNSLEVEPYTTKDGLIKELKICIPEWCNAGLSFTLMLYKYQKAGVRILLHWEDYYEGSEPKAELTKFANCSNGVVNDEFPKLKGWTAWHSVLAKHEANGEVAGTLIDDIWSEDWKDEAEKRLREQIEDSGLLSQINKWLEYKRGK